MTSKEDEQFTEFLRGKAHEGKAAVGYPATLFHQMLNADGGFNTVNRLLASQKLSDGYSKLVVLGRPDLTVEALVTETRWRGFFDPKLLEVAETRLRRTGYAFERFEEPIDSQSLAVSEVALVERPLPLASVDAITAAEWLKAAYQAMLTFESREDGKQQGDTPVRIYTLPNGAQVAIRMNKKSPAFYVRASSVTGDDIKDALAAITPITDIYTGQEQSEAPSSILHHAPYLKPAPTNILLRLNPAPGQYKRIFELALGQPGNAHPADNYPTGILSNRRVIDEEEFRRRQERNSETGKAGELAALVWERARLAKLTPPCPDPDRFVICISMDDVGAGYDILSTWPGQERYIEVKATVAAAPEFFMTENERRTLAALGRHAWIYRVELGSTATILTTFEDPASKFDGLMSPSAWRVKLP
jgi:hypothetical protein